MEMNRKRIEWIDTARFIGLYFMLAGHILEYAYTINKIYVLPYVVCFIYSFHMPLFFFLSGLTSNLNKDFKTTLKSSFKTLIIPYIFFYVVDTLFWVIFHYKKVFAEPVSYLLKFGAGFFVGYESEYSIYAGQSIWFFVALFMCKMIGYGFSQIRDEKKSFIFESIFVFLALCLTYIFFYEHITLILYLNEVLIGYIFFFVAKLLKLKLFSIETKSKILLFVFTVVALVLASILSRNELLVTMRGGALGEKYGGVLYFPTAFVGIFSVCFFSMLVPSIGSTLKYIVINSVIFVGINRFVILFIINVLRLFMKTNTWYFIVIASVVSLFFSYIPCFICSKFFPFLTGRPKK